MTDINDDEGFNDRARITTTEDFIAALRNTISETANQANEADEKSQSG